MNNAMEIAVADLESSINFALPIEYRNWLIKGQINVPEKNFYWVVKDDWGSGIERFYDFGLEYDRRYNLKEMAISRFDFKIPLDLLVIGDDGMAGTFICLGISGKNYGKVFFVDTAQTESGQYTDSKHVYPIGKDFNSWIKSLSDDPDE